MYLSEILHTLRLQRKKVFAENLVCSFLAKIRERKIGFTIYIYSISKTFLNMKKHKSISAQLHSGLKLEKSAIYRKRTVCLKG